MDDSKISESMGSGQVVGPQIPLLKNGQYDLAFDYYETVKLFGGRSKKLALWFRVISNGEEFESILPRYYNVLEIKGKPQRGGDFKVGRNSNFFREYVRIFNLPKRLDRIPMTAFQNVIIIGDVRTVNFGYDQKKLPTSLRYSVIDELKKVKEI